MKKMKRFFQALSLQLLGIAGLLVYCMNDSLYGNGGFWNTLMLYVIPVVPLIGFIWMCAIDVTDKGEAESANEQEKEKGK